MAEDIKVQRKSGGQKPGQEARGLTSGPGPFLQFNSTSHHSSLAESANSSRVYYLPTHAIIHFMNNH